MTFNSHPRRSQPRRRRLALEQLDARICLAADAMIEDGVLSITGSDEADTILVRDNGRGTVVVEDGDTGERSEFTGVEQISIDAGAGNDTIHVLRHGRGRSEEPIPELDILAGEGDDEVTVGLLLPAVQKVREAAARISVDLGEGNDRLNVRATGIAQVDLEISAGEGDDDVGVGLLLPAVQKVRDAAARMTVDLGGGNDKLRSHAAGVGDVELGLTAGEGDDAILIGLLLPAVQKVRESAARLNVDLGSGNNQLDVHGVGVSQVDLDVSAGDGDDDVGVGLLLPAVQKVRESASRITVNLGGGNDKLDVSSKGTRQVDLDVTAGEGDDAILIGLLLPAVQKVRESAARLHVDLGAGADTLTVRQRGYETFETNVISDDEDVVNLPESPRGRVPLKRR